MYRVFVEQQPTTHEADIDAGFTHELTARIEPPVSLTQEAVQSFLCLEKLEPISHDEIDATEFPDVMLVGSTEVATIIHAYLDSDRDPDGRQIMGDRCVGLLKLMGAEAEFFA